MVVNSYCHLVVGFGLLGLLSSLYCEISQVEKPISRLKREVEEQERQFNRAQRELAEARARLALAEGKRNRAILELRNVVIGYQCEVQWIRDHANWFCDPRDQMDEALWELAKARVRLAELEGDHKSLVDGWQKVVGFHEQRLQTLRRLEQMKAAKPKDFDTEKMALEKARKHLEEARKGLVK